MSGESHEIETIAELVELTTPENVVEMIQNVAELLAVVAAAKAAGNAVKLRALTWVDDGQAGISNLNLNISTPGSGEWAR